MKGDLLEVLRNPFTPSFGKVPPFLAGRDRAVDDLAQALDNGSGDPRLSTIFTGARGTGKTALLTCISREAQARGWVSVDVSARPGMLEGILAQTGKAAAHLVEPQGSRRLTGVQLGQLIGLEWEHAGGTPANWRIAMEALIDQLAEQDAGLLVTVDEVRADLDEMVELVSVYQHFVREDRKVALIMAGLPFKVSELLSNEDISFLRRAQHRSFGRIPDLEIGDAFRKTVEQAGRTIDDEALSAAVAA